MSLHRAVLVIAAVLLVSASPPTGVATDLITGDTMPAKLSDFRFFAGDRPNTRVVGYSLNTPLFSDYAEKDRFAFVPVGQQATYRADGVVEFPVGSALIKTFRYGAAKVETRVLLHRSSGWVALPYVWQGDDAVLKRAGTRIAMTVKGQAIDYAVPNVNQCKECHASGDAMLPIGPKARNLNSAIKDNWHSAGIATTPVSAEQVPVWTDPRVAVALQARAYLDANCGHCHNPAGAASNSGLNLTWQTTDPTALGIGKHPVAAGRGSGGRDVSIAPGAPDASIMVHRMASTEPGVAMPELGRAMVHDEGVALIRKWIARMPKK